MSEPLSAAVVATAGWPAVTRTATIVSTNPLQIDMGGTILDPAMVGILGAYIPNVGDVVVLLGQTVQGAESSASTWLLLDRITSAASGAHLAIPKRSSVVTLFTTTSGAFTTAGAAVCGFAFKGPASGRAQVIWNAELNHGTSFLLVSPQVALGAVVAAGAVFPGWVASDDRTRRNDAAAVGRSASADLLEGLTPGADYNIALYHRVGAGTGTIGRRTVTVSPEM
jgi:hypothetical protein